MTLFMAQHISSFLMTQAVLSAAGAAAAQLLWQLTLLISRLRVINKQLQEERPSFPWKEYVLGILLITIATLADILVEPGNIQSSLMISRFLCVVFAVGAFHQLFRVSSQRQLRSLASCVICIVLASNCALLMFFAKASAGHI